MANKKISELQSRTPALSDLILVGDPSSGYSYKCTVTALATIIETDIADGFVTIGTTQTISGAKTFSNNLTLTSVANTPTDPDKFLTLNASNVVTYRTGAEVLSDIGAADDTLVVHLAGTETITGYKTFSSFAGFDSAVSLKQNSTIVSQTGYSSIAASANGFFLTRATGIHAFLNLADLTTSRNFTFPDVTGTLALTTDITNALTSYVPNTRTLTINGVTQSLAANRTFNVGTVETVNFTTGTTGTDVNVSGSPITTIGTITLNIPTASATNRGALSSTDWSTFNNKQSTITLTTTGSSGSATFVSNTLNVPTYTLAGLGGISGSGTTNYIPKFTSSSAIGNSIVQDYGDNVWVGTNAAGYGTLNIQRFVSSPYATLTLTDQATPSNEVGIYLRANGSNPVGISSAGAPIAFYTGGPATNERMRLTSGGSLGIGTSSPNARLQVSNSSSDGIIISTTANVEPFLAIWRNSASNGVGILRLLDGGNIAFDNGATGAAQSTKMTLDASGRLGIGTSAPDGIIDVTSTVAGTAYSYFQNESTTGITSVGLAFAQSGTIKSSIQSAVYGNDYMTFNVGSNTERLRISSTGDVGIGTSSPSVASGLGLVLNGQAGQTRLAFKNNYTGDASTDGVQFALIGGSSAFVFQNRESDGYFSFETNGSERLRISSTGNVSIGNTNNTYKLDVTGTLRIVTPNRSFFVTSNAYSISDGTLSSGIGMDGAGLYLGNVISSTGWTIANPQLTLDASGNLGLGVTPQSWWSSRKAIEIFNGGAFAGVNAGWMEIWGNSYLDAAAATTRYLQNGFASLYQLGNIGSGGHAWFTAPSGTAGNAISFTQAMTLDASGRLGIGTTSPLANLDLGSASIGRRFTWENYSNLFSEYSSGDIWLSSNFYGNLGSSGYVTSTTATFGAAGIAVSGTGGGLNGVIKFFVDNAASKTAGASFTPTERMRITSGGELLINTTSDAGNYKLQVNGSGYFTGDIVQNFNTGEILLAGSGASNTVGGSSRFTIVDASTGKGWIMQQNANNDYQFWYNNGSAWSTKQKFNNDGSITTAAPSGGTAKPWKLGEAGVTLGGSNTSGVRVEIDGTVYYLVTGYLP